MNHFGLKLKPLASDTGVINFLVMTLFPVSLMRFQRFLLILIPGVISESQEVEFGIDVVMGVSFQKLEV